jgi:phage-related protein (TIGR01555 family)
MTDKAIPTLDSFQNFQAALGLGADNQISNSTYGFNPITRLRLQLEWMYRGSWLVGAAVDAPADDMCRAGIEFESVLEPEDFDALQAAVQDFGVWESLAKVIKWSRLYGGALGYIMIAGQDPESPLRLDTIGEGQFLGIMPLDRWMVQPTMGQLITELGPDFGLPKYYDLVQTVPTENYWPRIHHSRVIRMVGIELPWNQAQTEMMWGESVIERLYDRLVSYDSTSAGAAQLVYKAHLRIMKVEGLRNIIAAGGPPLAGLTAQISMMRSTQSTEGITLVDGKDEFEAQSYTFAGLSDIMLQFGQQISGALQIPLVRLFGQSPGGLNSTGESDLRTYYDHLAKEQQTKLRRPLVKILDIMSRSVLNEPLPQGFRFKFNPMWLITDKERAEIGTANTDSVIKAFESSLISQGTALKELRKASHITGLFTNITDEEIKDADDRPPLATEVTGEPDADEGRAAG